MITEFFPWWKKTLNNIYPCQDYSGEDKHVNLKVNNQETPLWIQIQRIYNEVQSAGNTEEEQDNNNKTGLFQGKIWKEKLNSNGKIFFDLMKPG